MNNLLPEDYIETASTEGWTPELRAAKRKVLAWAKKHPEHPDALMGYATAAIRGELNTES